MAKTIRVDLACNDPNSGLPSGRVNAVMIGNVEFYSNTLDWGPKLTEGDGWIRIGGMKLGCAGSKYGVGNWCWTRFWLNKPDVERLVNWAKFRKWFDIEQAAVGVFERYKAGKPLVLKRKPEAARG